MYKLVQFKAETTGTLMDLGRLYLQAHFQSFSGFAKEAMEVSGSHFYVKDHRWDQSKAKKVPVQKGATLTLVLPTTSPKLATAVGPDFFDRCVYCEDGLLVANKPSGLPSQSTFKPWEDNLYHQILLSRLLQKGFPKNLPYLGMHHRLDRDTSGLLLFSEKKSNNKPLSDLFTNRKIKKHYWALVRFEGGRQGAALSTGQSWTEDSPIGRLRHQKIKFKFGVTAEGQTAQTRFQVLKLLEPGLAWIKCQPITGRTHQIRVHLRHRGYKIVGDPVYGTGARDRPMRLHAQSLAFHWKKKGKEKEKPLHFQAQPHWPETLEVDTF